MWVLEAFISWEYEGGDVLCLGLGEKAAMERLLLSYASNFIGEIEAKGDTIVFYVEPHKGWFDYSSDSNTLRGDSRGFRCYPTITSNEDVRKFLGYGS